MDFCLWKFQELKIPGNHFGPRKSLKNILESHAFFKWLKIKIEKISYSAAPSLCWLLLTWIQCVVLTCTFALCWTFCNDYTLNIVSKCRFSLYLNICGLQTGPGKFFMGSWNRKILFWSVKEWEVGTLWQCHIWVTYNLYCQKWKYQQQIQHCQSLTTSINWLRRLNDSQNVSDLRDTPF